jgi:outer membrane protein OmpA-like peptidoglycan-associated protein
VNIGVRLLMAMFIAAVAAGCASVPADTVVLLPHADGTTGAVVMKQGKQEVVLDSAYASARSGDDGKPKAGRETEATVKKDFAAALAAKPPAPVSYTVYFLIGSDEFTDESKANLNLTLEEMVRRPSPEIAVIGHTDRLGSDQVNDALSLQRAQRVKDILIQRGVVAERISVAGRGERELLVPTADEIAEPRNRRVEITVR